MPENVCPTDGMPALHSADAVTWWRADSLCPESQNMDESQHMDQSQNMDESQHNTWFGEEHAF